MSNQFVFAPIISKVYKMRYFVYEIESINAFKSYSITLKLLFVSRKVVDLSLVFTLTNAWSLTSDSFASRKLVLFLDEVVNSLTVPCDCWKIGKMTTFWVWWESGIMGEILIKLDSPAQMTVVFQNFQQCWSPLGTSWTLSDKHEQPWKPSFLLPLGHMASCRRYCIAFGIRGFLLLYLFLLRVFWMLHGTFHYASRE